MAGDPPTDGAAAPPADPGLRLRAEDEDDLAVIAACLQDALVPVRDLAYAPAERTFFLVANRFRWEGRPTQPTAAAGGEAAFERVLCGVAFADIDAVAYRGFRRGEDERILSLLTIRPETGAIHLDFARGAGIRLETARIRCRARDVGEPWPTSWLPDHAADEPA